MASKRKVTVPSNGHGGLSGVEQKLFGALMPVGKKFSTEQLRPKVYGTKPGDHWRVSLNNAIRSLARKLNKARHEMKVARQKIEGKRAILTSLEKR